MRYYFSHISVRVEGGGINSSEVEHNKDRSTARNMTGLKLPTSGVSIRGEEWNEIEAECII